MFHESVKCYIYQKESKKYTKYIANETNRKEGATYEKKE